MTLVLFQKGVPPNQRAKRTSSGARTAVASAQFCAATTSTTVRTMALMKSTAVRKVCWATVNLSHWQCSPSDRLLPVSFPADTVLNDCHSNRTVCGDGDEAHCVVNGTDSFCSCKPGFTSSGRNRCQGTLASFFMCLFTTLRRFVFALCVMWFLGCFTDKNECKEFGVCSHICNNTKGSYKCSCHKYFSRINDTCKADSKYF